MSKAICDFHEAHIVRMDNLEKGQEVLFKMAKRPSWAVTTFIIILISIISLLGGVALSKGKSNTQSETLARIEKSIEELAERP